MATHVWRVALSLILAFLWITAKGAPVASAAATLTLDPSSAPPGAVISASGGGFAPGETVLLRWNGISGTVLARPLADSAGNFTGASLVVPAVSGGSYTVWALGSSSDRYTATEFTVTGAPAPTASATPPPTASATPSPTATPTATAMPSPTGTPVPVATTAPAPSPSPSPVPGSGTTAFPAGPVPGARAPVAIAVNATTGRAYVVHRELFGGLDVNGELLPTDRVSVVDLHAGMVLATVPVGRGLNGLEQGIAVDTAHNTIYVANADDATVSVIDGATNQVRATVQVGANPTGIAVDSAAGLAYVAHTGGVSIIDTTTGTVARTVEVPGSAHAMAVDTHSHLGYATVFPSWGVVAIDGRNGSVVAQADLPFLTSVSGIAVDPGRAAYVADHDKGYVAVLDISGGGLRETARDKVADYAQSIAVDTQGHTAYVTDTSKYELVAVNRDAVKIGVVSVLRLPAAVAVDSAGRRAYVADTVSDSITVIDIDAERAMAHIPLGSAPFALAYDAGKLYAANYPTDGISVLDAATRTLTAHWVSGAGPLGVAVDGALEQLYSLNLDDGTLTTLSTVDGSRKGEIAVGDKPQMIAVNRANHRVYATSLAGLTIMDGASLQKVATIPVGSRPAGIAVDEAGGWIYIGSLGDGTIAVLNATTEQVVRTLPSPLPSVWDVAVDPSLGQIYVTIPANTVSDPSYVEILDAASGALKAQIVTTRPGVPHNPHTLLRQASRVAVNPKTHLAFVTNDDDGTVSVIDGTSNTLLDAVKVGEYPNGMAIDPDSSLVYVANFLDGTVSVLDPRTIAVAPAPAGCGGETPVSGAPVLRSPAACSALPGFETQLQWDNPAGATQYELRVVPFNQDGPGIDLIRVVEGASGSFQILSPPNWYFLLPDMSYTWSVRTSTATTSIGPDDPNWGPWSPERVFRSPKATSGGITPVAPASGGAVGTLTPVLQWADSAATTWYYEIQLSTDPAFETDPARATAMVYWELRHGGVTSPRNSYTVPSSFPLMGGRTYYWRVRPRVQGDGTPVAWSSTWSFTTP